MKKTRLTKNELKRQKDALSRYLRFLPTLVLKKQQLQSEIVKIQHYIEEIETRIATLRESVYKWVAVFGEDIGIEGIIKLEKLHLSTGNIAGIDIPVFEDVDFYQGEYDLVRMPLWVDYGIEEVRRLTELNIQQDILIKQLKLVREELRITTQRVNLFEKVKIPEAREHIRRIRIFLGDLQIASVVTGKIAKAKIERKQEVLA